MMGALVMVFFFWGLNCKLSGCELRVIKCSVFLDGHRADRLLSFVHTVFQWFVLLEQTFFLKG
jgi:hypothetical protein